MFSVLLVSPQENLSVAGKTIKAAINFGRFLQGGLMPKENYGPGGFGDQYDNYFAKSVDRDQHPGAVTNTPFEDELDLEEIDFFPDHGEGYDRRYRRHGPRRDYDLGRGPLGTNWDQQEPSLDNFARSELRPDLNPDKRNLYYGVGPKDWKRSDERLKEDVCKILYQSHEVDPSDLEVEVKNSCVYLKGTIESRGMRNVAEDLILSIPGIEDVFSNLKIKTTH
ncbi:MAG: BON domain-containing protein [Bacteriovoracaceae bacterium]